MIEAGERSHFEYWNETGEKKNQSTPTHMKKEKAMENSIFECGICFYQSNAANFIPKTVSADGAALECPNCLNNDKDTFTEIDVELQEAA